MRNNQQTDGQKIGFKPASTSALKDLIIVAVSCVTVFAFSYFFNIFGFLVKVFRNSPVALEYIDEILAGLMTLSVGFAVFSWRRWKEMKIEAARRIALQEELLRIANTRAETERIINKQLEVEIEMRKEAERESLPHRRINK